MVEGRFTQRSLQSLGVSTSSIRSSDCSLKIASAFVNISSSVAAAGSVAARAASRGRTPDKDNGFISYPKSSGMAPGKLFHNAHF